MLSITIDASPALEHLDDISKRQLPFALFKSLNDTVLDVQKGEFAHQEDLFTLRRPEWVQRSNKIIHFAKKSEPWATIGIHPPGGDGRADILTKFETEKEKRPFSGTHVAIPIDAKRNKRDIILRGNRPGAFNFKQIGKAVRGDKGTFIVKTARGNELILQRTRRGVFAWYLLVPRVPIEPDLHFERIARDIIDRRWAYHFKRWWAEALRTAK